MKIKRKNIGKERIVFVGEGSSEPTTGFKDAMDRLAPSPVRFYFGVRRCEEGLDQLSGDNISITANFPGRGLSKLGIPLRECSMSSYEVTSLVRSNKIAIDSLLVVASPPDKYGYRSLGTVNGLLQSVIDRAQTIIIEEFPDLAIIRGAAKIPSNKNMHIVNHKPPAYSALSRQPDDLDSICAEYIQSLLDDNIALQIGVGGIIEALGKTLVSRKNIKIVSGAIGSTIRSMQQSGSLLRDEKILGTAIVGDESVLDWAKNTPNIQLMSSHLIHDPSWLGKIDKLHTVNIGITIDLLGNVNAERIGKRTISGKGGAPNFSQGATLSNGGLSIVALRTDKGECLVEKIDEPTIPSHCVDILVCEKGIADLRGKNSLEKRKTIEALFG